MQLTGYLFPCVPSKELPFIFLILFFSKNFSLKKQSEPLQQVYWEPISCRDILKYCWKKQLVNMTKYFIQLVFLYGFSLFVVKAAFMIG